MANTVRRTVLANTNRKLVVRQTEHCDGTTSTNNGLIVDLDDASNFVDTAGSALSADGFKSSGGKALTAVVVQRVWFSISGGDLFCSIKWDASSGADHLIASAGLPDGIVRFHDFTIGDWGGLPKDGANANGDIAANVSGMGNGEAYSIIIEMRKAF